jgi:hypothetical protein
MANKSRVVEVVAQGHDVKLAYGFFRRELGGFAARQTSDIGRALFVVGILERDRGFECLNPLGSELR